jgi:hypothetical protein
MKLVELRCKVRGCGKLLGWLESAPAESDATRWSGLYWAPVCPRHGGAARSVAKWVEKRRRAGLSHDRYRTGQWLPWAELRPAVRLARRTGETPPHFV